jgi:hypothetical protein
MVKDRYEGLTREQKIARIEALKEKKRRLLKAKPTYTPHEGQLKAHHDKRFIRIVTPGNGWGKSTWAEQEAWYAATGFNPITGERTRVPSKIIVLLDAPTKVKDVWLPGLRKWFDLDGECELKKNGKPYVEEVHFKNGSMIQFMFHEQQEMIFEGIEFDYLFADEPFPRHCWIGLIRGMRKIGTKPKIVIIGTPIGQPWIYNDLVKPALEGLRDDIGIHTGNTEQNRKNLAEGYIENFKKNLTEKEQETRLGGHWSHLEGLALAHLFKKESHVVRPFHWPREKPVVIVIDPHPAKANVAIMLGANGDSRVYYLKEFASKSAPMQYAAELKEFYAGYRVIDIVCDSLGETPGTGGDGNMSFSEKLRQQGVRVRSTTYDDKSDADFIQKIRQVLEIPDEADNFGRRVPKLAIFEGNKGIINDIETAHWAKVKHQADFKDKLDISKKDYLACLKYGLKTQIVVFSDTGKVAKVRTHKRSPWSGNSPKYKR